MSYFVKVVCGNCGWDGEIEVKDGELVNKQECPTCKCQSVAKRIGSSATRIFSNPITIDRVKVEAIKEFRSDLKVAGYVRLANDQTPLRNPYLGRGDCGDPDCHNDHDEVEKVAYAECQQRMLKVQPDGTAFRKVILEEKK